MKNSWLIGILLVVVAWLGVTNMRYGDLLEKLAQGQTLNAQEIKELKEQGERMEQVEALVSSWIQPGTTTPNIRNLQAQDVRIGAGDVTLDENGITIRGEGQTLEENAYKFDDADSNIFGGMYGSSVPESGGLNIVRVTASSSQNARVFNTAVLSAVGSTAEVRMEADRSALTGNAQVQLIQSPSGQRVNFNNVDWLRLDPTDTDPAYEDGYVKLYIYSNGTTQELRMRGKFGATETQVILADFTP